MSIKTNIVDYFTQIENLTNTNLQILKTINDSFFTKQNHLSTEINDTTYVIPSFISLENKINMLQENFENLVKSPETSEAYFNFDGNTRAIEVRKYNYAPDGITLPIVSEYNTETNNIFKDFMTPMPYINFDLPELPNDIVEVNVKKIVAKSEDIKLLLKNKLAYTKEEIGEDGKPIINTYYNNSINELYSNISKSLLNYIKDVDYEEYDVIHKLPTRNNIGHATYVIESVVSDEINEKLEEIITLKLRNNLKDNTLTNNLTYKLFDNTIEKPLQIGDELINYDGTGKVVITEVRPMTNTIVVKVVNGEYLNFLGTDKYDTNNDTDIHDMSKLRFYDTIDFNAHKYVKVPLEDDQYIFVCIAPINSRMNIQGSWGNGVIIDTHKLTKQNVNFNEYYENNVKNIGNVLFEMTSLVTSPITLLSKNEFDALTSIKPIIDTNTLSVMQINKHLNNSESVKNIRDAYRQKKSAESELTSLQNQINDLNSKLSIISFDDTIGTRNMYVSQLSKLNEQKNYLLTTINNAINDISLNVNSSEIPIDNAKYRVRGFYIPNIENVLGLETNKHIIGLKIQYRYKNVSSELGSAVSISNKNNTYIYSDWNTFNSPLKSKIAKYNETFDSYNYEYEDNNEDKNEPSYNQIDIPISQGETVDIRVKVIYDFGQPYITMTSDWSDIINIEFPVEFTKDVPILTIIKENNNDIETNRFNNILETAGVNSHINDSVIDQNITFYHKPDNISSGFYTDERRIIPLKDKLVSLSNEIAELKGEILGANENCFVSISNGDINTPLYSDRDNIILLESYSSFNDDATNGAYIYKNNIVSTILNISITNRGKHAMKLYPIFPGNRNILINNTTSTFVNKDNYCLESNQGVWFKFKSYSVSSKCDCGDNCNCATNSTGSSNSSENAGSMSRGIATTDPSTATLINTSLQTQNQFITFRINDVWTGTEYYSKDAKLDDINKQSSTGISNIASTADKGMIIYPLVDTKYGLCIESNYAKSYLLINPGEEVVVPMYCEYVVKNTDENNESIEKTISFDLRTSLYNEPINYSFKVVAKNELTVSDRLINKNKVNTAAASVTSTPKYNHIVK